MLTCTDLATGKSVWNVDAKKSYEAKKGFFGIACSPLVKGDLVLLAIGGKSGAGIVGFEKNTGKVQWQSTSDPASYSSPTIGMLKGKERALFLTRSRLLVLDPTTGKLEQEFPFSPPINSSVTAATPLVIDDLIFISASYGLGAAVLRLQGTGLEKLWANDETLSNHYANSVHHRGFLFGVHGRVDEGAPTLRCIELKTGKVRWEKSDFGAATLTLVNDHIFLLTERGELITIDASPDECHVTSRFQALGSQTRSYPALADGLFFARDKDSLVCLDLR